MQFSNLSALLFISAFIFTDVYASLFRRASPASTPTSNAVAATNSQSSADGPQNTDSVAIVATDNDDGKHWLHPHRLPDFGPKHELTPHRLDIVVYKASQDDGEVKAGDYYIDTSAAFRSKLNAIVQEAGCGGDAKRTRDTNRRQASCDIGRAMRAATQQGGPADIELPDWPQDLTIVNDNVAATVAQYLPAGATPYASTVFVAGYAFLVLTGIEIYLQAAKTMMPKIWVGEPSFKVKGGPKQNPTPTSTPSSTSSSSSSKSCPTGSDMPLCSNTKVCDGQKATTCQASGQYHDCSCIQLGTAIAHPIDADLVYVQNVILTEIANGPPAVPTPTKSSDVSCYYGADGGCDAGRLPCSWCDCTTKGKGWNEYSVASSTSQDRDPCPYTGHPGTKITWTKSTSTPRPSPTAKCMRDHCPVYYYGGLDRDVVIKAAENYCNYLTAGRTVTNNWPVACHWDVNDDQYGIAFYAYQAEKCQSSQQVVQQQNCVAAMHHAIDDCNTSESIKCGGSYVDIGNCVNYGFHTEPKNALGPRCRA